MIVKIILWWSEIPISKMFVFIKLDFKFISKRSMQLVCFRFLKQVGSIFKGESANVSKTWLRIGLVIVILKYPIKINCSYLFDSLLIKVSRLVVKSVSLRFGGFYSYIENSVLAYCYFYSQNLNVRRIFNFYGPAWQLVINLKSNSTYKFVSICFYKFITRYSKMIAPSKHSTLIQPWYMLK